MVNLIPKEFKKRKDAKSLVYGVTSAYVVVIAVILLLALGLKTFNYLTRVSMDDKQAKLTTLQAQQNKDKALATEAGLIQDRLDQHQKFMSTVDWNETLGDIAANTPTVVKVNSIKAATAESGKDPTATITGETSDAKAVVLFQDKLTVSKKFSSATITGITQSGSTSDALYTFSITIVLKAN